MAELDKKTQKTQTDLVQSVIEAYEKRNTDRVDVLITTAIKQLKMSRFKPDQTTCISLIYLARVCPRVFANSPNVKELLKSHVRRDNGPSNIKAPKNDIVLPVLASNILLASCDSIEVKTIILNRIEQWLGSNQKPTDMILHLLTALCMKSNDNQQTVTALIEMRHYWLKYLDDNFEIYGRVPVNLCAGIRGLLHNETSCESLIENLQFLIKHDEDIIGLSREISVFIIDRPISVDSMLKHDLLGNQLNLMLLSVYNKLFERLKANPEESIKTLRNPYQTASCPQQETTRTPTTANEPVNSTGVPKIKVIVKQEPGLTEQTNLTEIKKQSIKVEANTPAAATKVDTNEPKTDPNQAGPSDQNQPTGRQEDDSSSAQPYIPPLYMKLAQTSQVVAIDRKTIEAILSLLASIDLRNECLRLEFKDLLDCLLIDVKDSSKAYIYEDVCLTTPYYLPCKLRQKLIHSSNDLLIEFGLHCANIGQLLDLLFQFGLPIETLNRILEKFDDIKEIETIRSELKDVPYFNQLMQFYSDMGATGARDLTNRLSMVA